MTYIEKQNLTVWMMREARKYFNASMDVENRYSEERLSAWQMDRAIMGLCKLLVHGENFDKILSGNFDIEGPDGSEKKEVNND